MKVCTNCRLQYGDGEDVRPKCGEPLQQIPAEFLKTPRPAPVSDDPADHTAEFDPKDISDNKVFAMLPYLGLLKMIGIVISLLAAPASPYTMFHVRQGLKIFVSQVLAGICFFVLAVIDWFLIVVVDDWDFTYALAGISAIILFVVCVFFLVVQIIGFCGVCGGRAKEPPVIRRFGIMK